jgi:hypothetical protein
MKGHGFKSVVAENLSAMRPHLDSKQYFAKHKQMCWQCQKDKSRTGGYMKIQLGLCKFICADCLAVIAAKKQAAAQRTGGLPPESMVK